MKRTPAADAILKSLENKRKVGIVHASDDEALRDKFVELEVGFCALYDEAPYVKLLSVYVLGRGGRRKLVCEIGLLPEVARAIARPLQRRRRKAAKTSAEQPGETS